MDEEIWDLAQEVKKRRLTHSARNTRIFYLLQHLVRCAECGYLMGCRAQQTPELPGAMASPSPTNWTLLAAYYRCYGMENDGVNVPGAPPHQGGAA